MMYAASRNPSRRNPSLTRSCSGSPSSALHHARRTLGEHQGSYWNGRSQIYGLKVTEGCIEIALVSSQRKVYPTRQHRYTHAIVWFTTVCSSWHVHKSLLYNIVNVQHDGLSEAQHTLRSSSLEDDRDTIGLWMTKIDDDSSDAMCGER